MMTGEAIYLALILAAFSVYSVILFWAMGDQRRSIQYR